MIINVHAGHNPDGKTACGAVGIIKESTEARAITAKVIEKLRAAGHTVYDCTVDNGTGQLDVLKKIVAKCNEHTVDLDASIHLNSGRNDYVGDGSTGGTEVFCFNLNSKAMPYAQEVAREISALGFRLRDDSVKDDIKTSSTLYVLKNTKAPAMLIESFFVDDKDDVALYQKVGGTDGIAEAIVKGILKAAEAQAATTPETSVQKETAPAETAPAASAPEPTPQTEISYFMDVPVIYNEHVLAFQKALNADGFKDASGRKLKEDGYFGANTWAAVQKVLLSISTRTKYPNVTRWVQERVGTKVDGDYYKDSTDAVIAYQHSKGLEEDGVAGKNTILQIVKDGSV